MIGFKTRNDYYKETETFCVSQPNPTEKIDKCTKGDCVIRAFANALDMTWLEVFDLLCAKAREMYDLPNAQAVYEAFCKEQGYEKTSHVKKGEKRITAEEFALSHPKGRYVLYVRSRMKTHLTACVDGRIVDGWNCCNKYVYSSFKIR